MEIKELIGQVEGLTQQIRDMNEKRLDGAVTEASFKEFQEKADADRKKLEDTIEAMQTKLNTPGAGGSPKVESKAKDLFLKGLRTGNMGEYEQEVKAVMTVTDSETGGIFAPPDIEAGLLSNIRVISPFRQIARVRPTNASAVQFKKKTQNTSGGWTGEIESATASQVMKYGLETIPANEMTAWCDISQQDLDWADFDLEGDLRTDCGETFAILEGAAFVTGNGVKKPQGFLTHPDISVATTTGHATSIVSADAIKQVTAVVPEAYHPGARYVMNRSTRLTVELLKDGMDNYIWQRDLTGATPGILNGYPVTILGDMANLGAGSLSIAFGNFQAGYCIADGVGLTILRDPFTQALTRTVRFVMYRRVGGQVIKPEAIAAITTSA